MRNRIMAVAAQEITTKGYRNTHVDALTRKMGITTKVFYSHFRSKTKLLVEYYTAVVHWTAEYVASKQAMTADPGERLLWSLFANFRLHDLGASAQSEIRVEGTKPEGELRKPIEAAWKTIAEQIQNSFAETPASREPSTIPLELIDYCLLGAYDEMLVRAGWDSRYSREDLMRAVLWLFLAAQAARTGRIDIDSELQKYDELIEELGSRQPPLPPFLEV
jgi:AcrR family transcriptional regulator